MENLRGFMVVVVSGWCALAQADTGKLSGISLPDWSRNNHGWRTVLTGANYTHISTCLRRPPLTVRSTWNCRGFVPEDGRLFDPLDTTLSSITYINRTVRRYPEGVAS